MGSGFGRTYLALPEGPGHRVRICAARCLDMISTDAGPALFEQRAGRIADLNDWAWHYITGKPLDAGLAWVRIERLP